MQTFTLHNSKTLEYIRTADNLNKYDDTYIKSVIQKQIGLSEWPKFDTYVAIGSDGDVIAYRDGVLYLLNV